MNHRDLVTALSAIPADQVADLVTAADSLRIVEGTLAALAGKKTRRKRGPNKPKVEAPPAPKPAPAPAPKPRKKTADPKPLSSALDRLKSIKTPGLKVRRTHVEDEE